MRNEALRWQQTHAMWLGERQRTGGKANRRRSGGRHGVAEKWRRQACRKINWRERRGMAAWHFETRGKTGRSVAGSSAAASESAKAALSAASKRRRSGEEKMKIM